MRILTSMPLTASLLFLISASAAAQGSIPPVPRPAQRRPAQPPPPPVVSDPTFAIGGSLGATATRSDFLDNGLLVSGSVEGYLSRRVSIRGQVGAASWNISGLSYAGTLQPVFFVGNMVYYAPGADWRPYVTGGGGVYRYGFTEAGVSGSTTKPGFDGGGGIEYLATRTVAITGEALFHGVDLVPTKRATLGFKGSFWSIAVGAKKSF
jgi:hypothetical protein